MDINSTQNNIDIPIDTLQTEFPDTEYVYFDSYFSVFWIFILVIIVVGIIYYQKKHKHINSEHYLIKTNNPSRVIYFTNFQELMASIFSNIEKKLEEFKKWIYFQMNKLILYFHIQPDGSIKTTKYKSNSSISKIFHNTN